MNRKRTLSKDGSSNVTDERINTITHLFAAIMALMAGVLLIVDASLQKDALKIVSFSVYALSLFCLFLFSALHHGVNGSEKVERGLLLADYIAIFFLIAGTLTPICLILVGGPIGWAVFGVAWAVCIAGVTIKAVTPTIPKWVTLTIYISAGWLALFLCLPMREAVGLTGLLPMILGGLFYTIGGFIFIAEKPNPVPGIFGFHEIWHLFVMFGAAAHWFFIYQYIRPY